MARRSFRAVPAVAFLFVLIAPALGQDKPVDPGKFRRYGEAYKKALRYCLDNLQRSSLMEKVAIGFLLLADGRFPDELQQCIDAAKGAAGRVGSSKWSNWYIGFGGIFLSEVYKYHPGDDIKQSLEELAKKAAEMQEPTGGWFSSKGAAKKAGYPAQDHGQLTAMVFSTLLNMKQFGMEVPEGTFQKAAAYIQKQCGPNGITYGTGNPLGDTTGSRGGFALLGLAYAGMRNHKVFSTYASLYPRAFPKLREGHHIGGWHFMGVILGCHILGMVQQLANHWLSKLVSEQRDDGGFYLGDDKASGGEKGLFGGDRASTASLALLILLSNRPDRLRPEKRRPGRKTAKNRGRNRGGSPFGRWRPKAGKKSH